MLASSVCPSQEKWKTITDLKDLPFKKLGRCNKKLLSITEQNASSNKLLFLSHHASCTVQ